MASIGEVLEVLPAFRNAVEEQAQIEVERAFGIGGGGINAFAARGGVAAFSTPLTNIHATGVGVRVRQGKIVPNDFVIKVYVFDKQALGQSTPSLSQSFNGVEVDVEPLPVQLALVGAAPVAAPAVPPARQRHRPILGGLSIAPLNEFYVGTLGCFLRRVNGGTEQIFALSNNHVLADTNKLPIGTSIVQPGPEVAPSNPGDIFAALSAFVPIQFPTGRITQVINQIDAAIAVVTDRSLIRTGAMFGVANFTPQLGTPTPGMHVIKSGRTTGVTTGTITATRVRGVQVNYGTPNAPRIATYEGCIQIVGDNNQPFSAPGDSGSVILEKATGKPVALLFAGDGRTTTACDLGAVCRQFQAFPV